MWRKKKLVVITALSATLLLISGVIGGVVYAQDETPANDLGNTLFAKVATMLGIDQQKLEDAFTQAQKEMNDEQLTDRLNSMVEQGAITQEQADQYLQWWQAKPDVASELDFGSFSGMPGGHQGMPGPGGNPPPLTETPATN
jgi:hypothetical protein